MAPSIRFGRDLHSNLTAGETQACLPLLPSQILTPRPPPPALPLLHSTTPAFSYLLSASFVLFPTFVPVPVCFLLLLPCPVRLTPRLTFPPPSFALVSPIICAYFGISFCQAPYTAVANVVCASYTSCMQAEKHLADTSFIP